MNLAAKHLVWTASHAARAANRERRRALERDMAGCTSDADLADFEAVLDRYPDSVTHEMREILVSDHLRKHSVTDDRPFL